MARKRIQFSQLQVVLLCAYLFSENVVLPIASGDSRSFAREARMPDWATLEPLKPNFIQKKHKNETSSNE